METFSVLLALCAGNSPVNSPHKGQWRGALMFSLICAWINGWVNNREAVDLRRYRAHYDVTVMFWYTQSELLFINRPKHNLHDSFCSVLWIDQISFHFRAIIYFHFCDFQMCTRSSIDMIGIVELIWQAPIWFWNRWFINKLLERLHSTTLFVFLCTSFRNCYANVCWWQKLIPSLCRVLY